MKKRKNFGLAQWRVPVLSLAGLLAALTVLCLALLVSAQGPPVNVTKTASPDDVESGDTIQYTVVFSNSTGTAVDINVISDTLPTGFSFLSPSGSSDIGDYPDGGATTGTIVWSDSAPYTVPANDTLQLIYNVMVNADPNPTPYENHIEAVLETDDTIEASAPVTVEGVEMTGSKIASASQVPKGGTVDYTVNLRNDGATAATLSDIVDTLPAAFAFERMVSGLPAPNVQGNVLTWAGPFVVDPDGELEFTYRVRVGGTIGQTYGNSVQTSEGGDTLGPYQANVTVLKPKAFLPIVIKTSEPTAVYRLAYDSKPGDNFEIFAINADGTEFLNVSQNSGGDGEPVWSPDGTEIAWTRYFDGNGDIVVANADGTNERRLTDNAARDWTPAWSPQGDKIAFTSLRTGTMEVYVMNADGSNETRLTDEMCQSHNPVWSPDGTKIGFVCGKDAYAEVYIMNTDGSNPTRLTNDDTSLYREDHSLSWSPDGIYLAYVKYYSKRWIDNRDEGNIFVVNVTNGSISQLTFDNDPPDHAPDWSPDGSKIVFSTYVTTGNGYEIATMDPNGNNMNYLTQSPKGDFSPQWSSDGLKIAFTTTRANKLELYVMDADGGNQFRLDDLVKDADSDYRFTLNWRPVLP